MICKGWVWLKWQKLQTSVWSVNYLLGSVGDIQITFISCVENCTFFRNVGPTASHCVSHYSKVKTSVICPKIPIFFYSYMKIFCEHSLVSQEILSEKEVSMKYEGYLIKARRNRSLWHMLSDTEYENPIKLSHYNFTKKSSISILF